MFNFQVDSAAVNTILKRSKQTRCLPFSVLSRVSIVADFHLACDTEEHLWTGKLKKEACSENSAPHILCCGFWLLPF